MIEEDRSVVTFYVIVIFVCAGEDRMVNCTALNCSAECEYGYDGHGMGEDGCMKCNCREKPGIII